MLALVFVITALLVQTLVSPLIVALTVMSSAFNNLPGERWSALFRTRLLAAGAAIATVIVGCGFFVMLAYLARDTSFDGILGAIGASGADDSPRLLGKVAVLAGVVWLALALCVQVKVTERLTERDLFLSADTEARIPALASLKRVERFVTIVSFLLTLVTWHEVTVGVWR